MSVAQVEAANHFPNERSSRPKNGPPSAGDDGSSDRVHHHHHSNGATIADNSGRSASRYDTTQEGYSYPKSNLPYTAKHQYPTSIDSSEMPIRSTRTQTNASAAAASNPNPNPTSSNNSSNQPSSVVKNPSPLTTHHHDAATGDATPSAARVSLVTTPVSPPPSPPLLSGPPASGPAVKPPSAPAALPASSSSSRGTTPRPTAPATGGGSASPKEPSPIPSNSSTGGSGGVANAAVTTPARGGSLASLLHSDHRDVTDSDSRKDIMHGTTPPSPDSLPQVGHSRNPSMAESNSTTLRESPSKENKDEDEEEEEEEGDEAMMMDVDHSNPPTHSNDSATRNTSETTATAPGTSLSIPTQHPARHLASRSPQPQPQPPQPPHSHSHSSSSAGVLAPSQPRSQPSPSATSVAQQPYPHPSHVSTQIPRHQSTNTNTSSSTTNNSNINHHASSRSQSDRHPLPPSSVPAAGYAHATQTPTSESSPPNARPFRAGATDERDRQIDALKAEREHLLRTLRMNEENYSQQIQELQRRDNEYRLTESSRAAWLNAVSDWVREGQRLLSEGGGPVMLNGYGPSSAASQGGRQGGLLSSAMVGSSSRDYDRSLERDRTLSVASPYSPVAHNRSYSHTQEHQRYPSQSSSVPNHFDPSGRRGANAVRPTAPPQGNGSLRRARRPSSDDLAAQAGGKRIKTDNGDYIRVSPDAHARDYPDSRPLPPSGVSTPIDPRRAPAYGREGTANSGTVAPSDKRGSGSLGSGTERGRDSPSDRRTAGRDEDEEFPSPRRPYATPTTATGPSMAGNGRVSRGPSNLETVAALATAGEDADVDADGSPDPTVAAGLGAHKELMELAEEDPEGLSRGSLRRPKSDGLRNGSRSSMNSQDLDEMLAEAVGDEDPSIARYGTDTSMRSTTKQRHRAASNTLTRNPGGSISAFPLQFGSHPDLAQSRAYPASSQPKYGSGLPSGNSRGYVFRNMDPAEMEAQSQARSPEESLQRQSFSGSLPTGSAGSPPIPNPGPMTMQFLPPQSGPPMPKKIYHHKGTGQVIGSQHAGMAPTLGGSVDPNSAAARGAPPSGFMTIDGQMKRTCKQCGQPGRYKDNKCVEKWGPGPQGPGTVCDRCRKKMKRVEKRATQDSAMMTAAVNHHHQYPIAPAPPVSYAQLPVQGSHRFDESQESGYSQPTDDGRPSLSRAGSQNYSSMHQSPLNRRGSYVSDSAMRREPSHSYQSSMNPPRETMPPPSSFTNTHSSPESGRGEARSSVSTTGLAADSRDGEVDADGDAEMDELMEEELGAAADAVTNASHRNRVKGESP